MCGPTSIKRFRKEEKSMHTIKEGRSDRDRRSNVRAITRTSLHVCKWSIYLKLSMLLLSYGENKARKEITSEHGVKASWACNVRPLATEERT
jgi:hypothetical protein